MECTEGLEGRAWWWKKGDLWGERGAVDLDVWREEKWGHLGERQEVFFP